MFSATGLRNFVTRRGRALPFTLLGFGSATLGNLGRVFTEEECDRTLAHAWKRACAISTTAPLYGLGLSEARLGRNLSMRPRGEYLLSTKVGRLLEHCAPGESNAGVFVTAPDRKFVYDYSMTA